MPSYGRTVTDTAGRSIQVSGDGKPDWKHGGITIDWDTVTAVAADTTLDDGTVVKDGDKYLRYGTVLDLIGTGEVQTIDLSGDGDPTGGTWSITFDGQTTAALAWNASAGAVADALHALSNLGPGDVTVGLAGFVYTLTFAPHLGNVAQVTATDIDLTSGTSITITIATTTAGTGNGKWGPVDTSATDGRQNMARGESYILNETVVYSEGASDHPAVIEGGLVFEDRLVVGGANEPTLANVLTAFPRLRLIKENA